MDAIQQSDKSSVDDEDGDDKILEEEEGGEENGEAGENNTAPPEEPQTPLEKIKALCCPCRIPFLKKDEKELDGDVQKPELTVEIDAEKGTTLSTAGTAITHVNKCKDELMDIWTWFRSHTKSFIYCIWFENGIMLCIVINTACLAIDSPGLKEEVKIVLTNINDVS